jgi:hypothetical protein
LANDKRFVVKNGLTALNVLFTNDISGGNTEIVASIDENQFLSFDGNVKVIGSIHSDTIEIDNANQLRLKELSVNGSNYVAFKSPDSLAANYTLTLPESDGSSGYMLTTNGSGSLLWEENSGAKGGGTNKVFFENDILVTDNYTITTSRNAMSTGPVTIDDGVIVTIPTGSRWVVI